MEAILTQEDHERIANLAAIKTFSLIKDYLEPKEEKIKTNRSYSAIEAGKIFNVTPHTIRKWHDTKKECLLKKNKVDRFTGISVKDEYERINGKK